MLFSGWVIESVPYTIILWQFSLYLSLLILISYKSLCPLAKKKFLYKANDFFFFLKNHLFKLF